MDWLVGTLGREGAVALFALLAAAGFAEPLVTAWHRRGWTTKEAEVLDIAARRALASPAWPVQVRFHAGGKTREAVVPVNLVRRPLRVGDRIRILHHPRFPGRTAAGVWQGAGTGAMIGVFFALGAMALAGG